MDTTLEGQSLVSYFLYFIYLFCWKQFYSLNLDDIGKIYTRIYLVMIIMFTHSIRTIWRHDRSTKQGTFYIHINRVFYSFLFLLTNKWNIIKIDGNLSLAYTYSCKTYIDWVIQYLLQNKYLPTSYFICILQKKILKLFFNIICLI